MRKETLNALATSPFSEIVRDLKGYFMKEKEGYMRSVHALSSLF